MSSDREKYKHGGKVHTLSFSAVTRRGPLSAYLYTRLSFAAGELDSERLQLIWHQLPFGDFRLRVNVQDSSSPWRRIAANQRRAQRQLAKARLFFHRRQTEFLHMEHLGLSDKAGAH